MRRGFTLIELLVVIGILAAMMGVATVSFTAGRGAFRLKGAARDVFAAIRKARSTALVTQKPCIITYSVDTVGETCRANVEISGTELMKDTGAQEAWTLSGERVIIGGDEIEPTSETEEGAALAPEKGHTATEMLFPSISKEVMEGIRLKVVSGNEELPQSEGQEEMRKARISIYSNVDYLLGKYKKAKEEESAAKAEEEEATDAKSAAVTNDTQEPVSFVWQVNGRCEPHRVYVYTEGSKPEDGLLITVDRFGAVKVISPGEEED